MNYVINAIVLITISLSSSFLLVANAEENTPSQGYISDDLFIYMHAGPGTNYRILGTVIAGTEVKVTGKADNEYSEIIDEKGRATWIESKYLTSQPGLRFVVAELNGKLASSSDFTSQLDGEVNALKNKINTLTDEKKELTSELDSIKLALEKTEAKVKDQDTNIKKQWFFTGAAVLGIGLLLGLIIPRLFSRRRGSMESWS